MKFQSYLVAYLILKLHENDFHKVFFIIILANVVKFKQVYLVFYNLWQFIAYSYVLIILGIEYAKKGEGKGYTYHMQTKIIIE